MTPDLQNRPDVLHGTDASLDAIRDPQSPAGTADSMADLPISLKVRLINLGAVIVPFAGLVAGVILLWGVAFDWTHLLVFFWVFLMHHITWSVNSVCHIWGARPFRTKDQSRDNVIVGVLGLGEGWHNGHHAFPTSAKHGLGWWKIDVSYLVIRAMGLVGLASAIRVPSAARLAAKRA